MFRHPLTVTLTACTLALALSQSQAHAQPKPFIISGSGVGPVGLPLPGQPARPHTIAGVASQLGAHTGAGSVQTDSAFFHPNGVITGEFGSATPFRFTGADGDVLSCHYGRTAFGARVPGRFELLPAGLPGVYVAVFLAEFVPVAAECTGKFAGVTGSWLMLAISDPFVLGSSDPFNYSWRGAGVLTYRRGR